jgi:hypothetical protein
MSTNAPAPLSETFGHSGDDGAPSANLIPRDGVPIRVPVSRTLQSLLLRDLLDGNDESCVDVPLDMIEADTLHLVTDYMELRHGFPPTEIERPLRESLLTVLDEKDKRFIEPLDEEAVLKLVKASNFLNYPALKALACARCADWMKDKTLQEIRDMFNLTCDFTPDEIAALKKEHDLEA